MSASTHEVPVTLDKIQKVGSLIEEGSDVDKNNPIRLVKEAGEVFFQARVLQRFITPFGREFLEEILLAITSTVAVSTTKSKQKGTGGVLPPEPDLRLRLKSRVQRALETQSQQGCSFCSRDILIHLTYRLKHHAAVWTHRY